MNKDCTKTDGPDQLSELLKDPQADKRFHQESLLVDTACAIYHLMLMHDVTRRELAKRLGISKQRVKQYLGGYHDFDVRELSDVFWALGHRVRVKLEPKPAPSPESESTE